MRAFCLLLFLSVGSFAQMKDIIIMPSTYNYDDISGINILDAKVLSFKSSRGIAFTDISALAYEKSRGLYALSNKGYLFRLELKIEDSKIQRLNLEEALLLKTKKAKPLKKKRRDAEGMAFSEDGLIISFERDPKVSLYDFKGKKIKNIPLPEVLYDIGHYQKKNKALEAVALHPDFGIITAPEAPLKGSDENIHTLYSLSQTWKFKASGNITSIEVMPDNDLLILERDFHLLRGHSITLKKLNIMQCNTGVCPTKTLASLKSTQGWEMDNFEGLTHVKDNMYLMVSDDNGSFFQKCILVLFEVKN